MPQILGVVDAKLSAPSSGYDSIATVTLGSPASTITFSGIAGTYASLQLRLLTRNATANTSAYNVNLRFNADSGTNYAWHLLEGTGAAASAAGVASTSSIMVGQNFGNSSTASVYAVSIVDIHDYASSSRNKTVRSFSGYDLNGSGFVDLNSGVWLNTATVTEISLLNSGSGFLAGTTAALYGIKAA